MSILYDVAQFPVKSVFKSLHILERNTIDAGHKTESVAHGKNEKVIICHTVGIRVLTS